MRDVSPVIAWTTICLLVGAIALAAVPRSHGCPRPGANGSAAIATLRNLTAAQQQFRSARWVDLDDDGRGEVGFFEELSAAVPPRRAATPIRFPALTKAFRNVSDGTVLRSGYRFRLSLPAAGGGWTARRSVALDTERAEREFRAVAWPEPGTEDDRVFVLDRNGAVWSWKDDAAGFRGLRSPPPLTLGSNLPTTARQARDAQGRLWARCRP